MPKYNDFDLDIQNAQLEQVGSINRTDSMMGATCPECHPISKVEACDIMMR